MSTLDGLLHRLGFQLFQELVQGVCLLNVFEHASTLDQTDPLVK